MGNERGSYFMKSRVLTPSRKASCNDEYHQSSEGAKIYEVRRLEYWQTKLFKKSLYCNARVGCRDMPDIIAMSSSSTQLLHRIPAQLKADTLLYTVVVS